MMWYGKDDEEVAVVADYLTAELERVGIVVSVTSRSLTLRDGPVGELTATQIGQAMAVLERKGSHFGLRAERANTARPCRWWVYDLADEDELSGIGEEGAHV